MRGVLDIPESLVPVQQALAATLTRVEQVFEDELDSDLPPVSRLCRHIERYRGKMLRPTLVILCGLAAHPCHRSPASGLRCSGEVPRSDPGTPIADLSSLICDNHITIAAVVEMVHMATLVHDDVLDEADTRRRGQTVNRLHGNEAAVILGDYLIASAYHLCSKVDSATALAIGRASQVMCSGELLQLHHRADFSIDEPTYFEIIERKTAALIGVSCELGARHAGAPHDVCRNLELFGRRVGAAFQIQDDLLDLTGRESLVGKPLGKDAQNGKLTLPVIHHLGVADARARGRTLTMLDDIARRDAVGDDLRAALDSTGSFDYARQAAARLVDDARAVLTALPDSGPARMLAAMAQAVISRSF